MDLSRLSARRRSCRASKERRCQRSKDGIRFDAALREPRSDRRAAHTAAARARPISLSRAIDSLELARRAEDALDELSFAFDVRFPIEWIPRSELVFECGVFSGSLRIRAQVVPKQQVVAPEIAVRQREVNVILSRISAPEEMAAGNPLLASVDVVRALQGVDCARQRSGVGRASEDVENRFGGEAGDRGTARVLDS